MGEEQAVARGGPFTRAGLSADLRSLGVTPGSLVLVHSSLSKIGYVAGGAHAVVLALLDAVGPDGTIVVPTHSTHLTDPARWVNPPVPESWWPVLRLESPPFDPRLTATRQMGAIVECLRDLPGAVRSDHPHHSFTAVGPAAALIVGEHSLANSLGEESPLARLYAADALVLLLGVGHGNNTSFHLGEHRGEYPGKAVVTQGARIMVEGEARWVEFPELDYDSDDFEALGAEFTAAGKETHGRVGEADAVLMRQRDAVDFAAAWFGRNRPGAGGGLVST